MKPSREIRDLVLGFIHDFAAGDPSVADLFSTSENTILIGTDPDEFWTGGTEVRALVRNQFDELLTAIGGAHMLPPPKDIKVIAFEEDAFGWAAASVAAIDPSGSLYFRFTLVFRKEQGDWKIVHAHASNPMTNLEAVGVQLTTSIEDVAHLVERERPDVASATSPEGTVTIMFTDLESSTATNEAMGDDAFLPLLLKHNEIVRGHVGECRGTVVKSQGDGFMLAFPSARRAVECAIRIQRDIASIEERFRVRMGLHTGEPVRSADDFYGRDVAYAARIGSAAVGGEILVSSLVRSLVDPSGSVIFTAPRELDLKGFDDPQTVYGVRWSVAEPAS